ncbi:hypothetical protein [Gemmatimonas sp.]|uniref:hypothetical protein n=1 Tax=Gemmatimonas sp. TaxID=1962908 RepID=UPI00286B3133|nr:hypothetical protein [Gemmatimonas sp.]
MRSARIDVLTAATPSAMALNLSRVCSLLSLLTASACVSAAATEPTTPLSEGNATVSPYRNAAFIVDISTTKRAVKVAAPSGGIAGGSLPQRVFGGDVSVQPSLLGGDAVEMMASNYSAGVIGASAPGKILVTFDLTLVNRLRGLRLVTPTFPLPPNNVTGIQAFPIEVVALTTAGGATVTGGAITVTSPRSGTAVPSADWDGAPHSFFNDVGCGGLSNDCFRYEPFGTLDASSASPARRVGFLVDPTVGDLRVRIIVAADLQSTTR